MERESGAYVLFSFYTHSDGVKNYMPILMCHMMSAYLYLRKDKENSATFSVGSELSSCLY